MQVISVDATIIISDRYILNVIFSSLNLVNITHVTFCID